MDNYSRIADSLTFLAENFRQQPSLAQLSARANLSESHFQRIFTEWAGVSPKKFLQVLTLGHAQQCLDESQSVFDASLDAGLSGPSRLHDLFVNINAMSPGEYKLGGEGLKVQYGTHESPFGPVVIMLTPRGISALSFVADESPARLLEKLKQRLPNATYIADQPGVAVVVNQVFKQGAASGAPLSLLLSGTPFQLQVWRALLEIPSGAVVTYSRLAKHIGRDNAQRAVGNAVALNPVACLIPCHRVIRENGLLGGYRWGQGRKLALLGTERLQAKG